jgi:hypothetical protein
MTPSLMHAFQLLVGAFGSRTSCLYQTLKKYLGPALLPIHLPTSYHFYITFTTPKTLDCIHCSHLTYICIPTYLYHYPSTHCPVWLHFKACQEFDSSPTRTTKDLAANPMPTFSASGVSSPLSLVHISRRTKLPKPRAVFTSSPKLNKLTACWPRRQRQERLATSLRKIFRTIRSTSVKLL